MKQTLIVTGGSININWFQNWLKEKNFDYIIAVDKGLEALDLLKIEPNYIIGDFDSINKTVLDKYKYNIITLNKEKDFTDTHMALKLAIKLKSNEITIIGGTGTRIDHTLANIHILKEALDSNIKCSIINENNKIFLIDKPADIKKDTYYKYISLIPLTTTVESITLDGCKYLLKNATLKIGESIGISNEQLEEKTKIDFKAGILIAIYSKD